MSIFDACDFRTLPAALRGRTVHLPDGRDIILRKVSGFGRKENDTPSYRPMFDMNPGDVFVPRVMASFIWLVVCKDGADTGGCVAVEEIEADGQVIKGKGRVASAVGFSVHRTTGRLIEELDNSLTLSVSGALSPSLPASKKPGSHGRRKLLSQAIVKRHMGKIVDRFNADPKGKSLEDFVDEVRRACQTEDDLEQFLKPQS